MNEDITRLLDTMITDMTAKAIGLSTVTDSTYEAAAAAVNSTTPEIADALYATANELHKASEAIQNAASILETAKEKIRW